MTMGLIHVYAGDGKGKTTAAAGLCTRAAGNGMAVLFVQFMKGRPTGETESLKKLGVEILRNSRDYGFLKGMTPEDKNALYNENTDNLKTAVKWAWEHENSLVVLDEIMVVYNNGLIDKEEVKDMVLHKPDSVELVLTGRNPDEFFVENCDYYTEMMCRKHPFKAGIRARRGIEY